MRATSGVLELEKRLASGVPAAFLRDIEALEWRTLETLANGRWASVLPIALLYMDLAQDYRGARLYPLTDHALRMAARLAETIAEDAVAPDQRIAAAQTIASLAGIYTSPAAVRSIRGMRSGMIGPSSGI